MTAAWECEVNASTARMKRVVLADLCRRARWHSVERKEWFIMCSASQQVFSPSLYTFALFPSSPRSPPLLSCDLDEAYPRFLFACAAPPACMLAARGMRTGVQAILAGRGNAALAQATR